MEKSGASVGADVVAARFASATADHDRKGKGAAELARALRQPYARLLRYRARLWQTLGAAVQTAMAVGKIWRRGNA